eukprot:175493-Pelagomonas_calceolata.AAC.4
MKSPSEPPPNVASFKSSQRAHTKHACSLASPALLLRLKAVSQSGKAVQYIKTKKLAFHMLVFTFLAQQQLSMDLHFLNARKRQVYSSQEAVCTKEKLPN